MNQEGADVPHTTKLAASLHGPAHYKELPIEPWDIIVANRMGFFDGNALKYLLRYKGKNGKDDLKKAIHYLEKLIELEYPE